MNKLSHQIIKLSYQNPHLAKELGPVLWKIARAGEEEIDTEIEKFINDPEAEKKILPFSKKLITLLSFIAAGAVAGRIGKTIGAFAGAFGAVFSGVGDDNILNVATFFSVAGASLLGGIVSREVLRRLDKKWEEEGYIVPDRTLLITKIYKFFKRGEWRQYVSKMKEMMNPDGSFDESAASNHLASQIKAAFR